MASSNSDVNPVKDPLQEHVDRLWADIEAHTGETWPEEVTNDYKAMVREHLVKLIEKVVSDSPTTKLVLAVQAAQPQLTAMRDQARHFLSRGEHSAAAIQSAAKLEKILQALGELVLSSGPVEAHPGRHGHG